MANIENKCPLCGKHNPAREWYCEACGAKLPLHGQRQTAPPVPPRQTPKAAPKPAPVRRPSPMPTPPEAPRMAPKAANSWASCGCLGCGGLFFFFILMPLGCAVFSPTPEPTPEPLPVFVAPTSLPTPPSFGSGDASSSSAARGDACSTGATAVCDDGTTSYAEHHRGACSHHGGVSHFCD